MAIGQLCIVIISATVLDLSKGGDKYPLWAGKGGGGTMGCSIDSVGTVICVRKSTSQKRPIEFCSPVDKHVMTGRVGR